MFEELRREMGIKSPAEILRDRPAQQAAERVDVKRGRTLRGINVVKGKYVCTVCGYCCFHHEKPVCENGSWIRREQGCVLCGLQGIRLDDQRYSIPMNWWQGRMAALQTQQLDRRHRVPDNLPAYVRWMHEQRLDPIRPWSQETVDYFFAQQVLRPSPEDARAYLDESMRRIAGTLGNN